MTASLHTKNIMKICLIIGITFLTIESSAQNDEVGLIDSMVSHYHENGMFNGTILIASEKEIVYHKSLGFAHHDNEKILDKNTPICLASITKQFTAAAIMILKNQNKIKYSDTLEKFFPELPEYLHQIKVINLIQHTSGLKRAHYQSHQQVDNDLVLNNLMGSSSDSLLFEPETDLKYSNTAYILLALIIEKASGISYEQFLHENIFAPLGMTNTFVYSAEDSERTDIAIAFDGFGNKDNYDELTYGSAGIYSTPEDLFRWTQTFTTDQIIPYEKKKRAYEQAVSKSGLVLDNKIRKNTWGYGFGLRIFRDELEGVVCHSGAFGGFYNFMAKDLKNDYDVIVLTNNGRLLDINNFGKLCLNILRNQDFEMPLLSIHKAIRKKCLEDIDGGITYYRQLKKNHPTKYNFESERELNLLGYSFLAIDRIQDAIKIFELLIEEFPDAPNPYDSLGEAYFLRKEYIKAIESYKKAIELGGTNGNAKSMIIKIEEQKNN